MLQVEEDERWSICPACVHGVLIGLRKVVFRRIIVRTLIGERKSEVHYR